MKIIGENVAWEDGDTVVIRFVRKRDPNETDGEMLSDSYTYRREDGFWPGEGQWWSDKTDFDMTKAWHEYRLRVPQMESAPQPTQKASLPHHYVLSERYVKDTYGAWCYACSEEAQDYVYPCNKPDRAVPPHTLVAKEPR